MVEHRKRSQSCQSPCEHRGHHRSGVTASGRLEEMGLRRRRTEGKHRAVAVGREAEMGCDGGMCLSLEVTMGTQSRRAAEGESRRRGVPVSSRGRERMGSGDTAQCGQCRAEWGKKL